MEGGYNWNIILCQQVDGPLIRRAYNQARWGGGGGLNRDFKVYYFSLHLVCSSLLYFPFFLSRLRARNPLTCFKLAVRCLR